MTLTFGAAIDELAGVHAFNSNEILLVLLEFVLVSEYDLSERGATAGIMHDILDNTLDVSKTEERSVELAFDTLILVT